MAPEPNRSGKDQELGVPVDASNSPGAKATRANTADETPPATDGMGSKEPKKIKRKRRRSNAKLAENVPTDSKVSPAESAKTVKVDFDGRSTARFGVTQDSWNKPGASGCSGASPVESSASRSSSRVAEAAPDDRRGVGKDLEAGTPPRIVTVNGSGDSASITEQANDDTAEDATRVVTGEGVARANGRSLKPLSQPQNGSGHRGIKSSMKAEVQDNPPSQGVVRRLSFDRVVDQREASCEPISGEGATPRGSTMNFWMDATRLQRQGTQRIAAKIIKGIPFKVLVCCSLWLSLLFAPMLVLCNVPDDPGNSIQDAVLILVLVVFFVDIVLASWAQPDYRFSAFFWMDLFGSIALIFDISCVVPELSDFWEQLFSLMLFLRAARAAKLAARLARLHKTIGCIMWLLPREPGSEVDEIQYLSRLLRGALTTRVVLLSMFMLVVASLLDISNRLSWNMANQAWELAWATSLASAYTQELASQYILHMEGDELPTVAKSYFEFNKGLFKRQVEKMLSDTYTANVHPIELRNFPEISGAEGPSGFLTCTVLGSHLVSGDMPARSDALMQQEGSWCRTWTSSHCEMWEKAYVVFDITPALQWEAAAQIAVTFCAVTATVVCCYSLSSIIDTQVLTPVHRMLGIVRIMTSGILQQVKRVSHAELGEVCQDPLFHSFDESHMSEITFLEMVLSKLAKLTKLFMQQNVVDEEEMKGMCVESKAVIQDMMMLGKKDKPINTSQPRPRRSSPDFVAFEIACSRKAVSESLRRLSVEQPVVDSWDLNIINFQEDELNALSMYVFFDSTVGMDTGRAFCDTFTFGAFYEAAKNAYLDQPYHNFRHAIDVLHCVYRFLQLSESENWLSSVSQYALLISALAHDIGHMGRTNQFLVETGHELALRYNDKSPLENMHCSTFFTICSNGSCNVFRNMERNEYAKVRQVVISAILHTDNSLHFEMVKDIAKIYELNSVLCNHMAKARYRLEMVGDNTTNEAMPTNHESEEDKYHMEVLSKNSNTLVQLFLHLADVSNPCKPFEICAFWAHRVLDEFFAQGDEEKALGIPVGMLNDRAAICRPSSQHGFINFLVAPIVLGSTRIFPSFLPMAENLVTNLQMWRDLWVQEVSPSTEDVAKRDEDIAKAREQVRAIASVAMDEDLHSEHARGSGLKSSTVARGTVEPSTAARMKRQATQAVTTLRQTRSRT